MIRMGLFFPLGLLIGSVSVCCFSGVEALLEQEQTAAHLRLSFDRVIVSDRLFTCGKGHSSYNYKRTKCLLRLSVCPIVPELEATVISDRSLRRCLQRATIGSKGRRNSKMVEVSPGKGMNVSNSDLGNEPLLLDLGQAFTNYMKWRLMRIALLVQGMKDVADPSRDNRIAEFVLPLPTGNGKLVDRFLLDPQLQNAENVIKNVSADSLFRLADVSFRAATTCSQGFFPEGECTVFTGCRNNVSSCVQCDPITGASICDKCGSQPSEADGYLGQATGNWSDWSSWSDCPAECGWSLATEHRQCNNPPPFGARSSCEGSAVRLKVCRNRICSERGSLQTHKKTLDRLASREPPRWHHPPKKYRAGRPQTREHISPGKDDRAAFDAHQDWVKVSKKILLLQSNIERQRTDLHGELRFWVRTCAAASFGSLVLTVAWICYGVCRKSSSNPQPEANSPSSMRISRATTAMKKKTTEDKMMLLKDDGDDAWSAAVDVQPQISHSLWLCTTNKRKESL